MFSKQGRFIFVWRNLRLRDCIQLMLTYLNCAVRFYEHFCLVGLVKSFLISLILHTTIPKGDQVSSIFDYFTLQSETNMQLYAQYQVRNYKAGLKYTESLTSFKWLYFT